MQHTHRTHWAHSTQASHTAAYTVQTDSHSQHSTAHFTEKKFIEHLFGWILALDWRQSSPIACQERIIDPAWWNSAPLLVGQCAQSISGDVTRRIYTMSDDSYVFKPFCMASFFGIVRMVWWYCVRIRGWLSVCVCCSIALRCALCVLLSCLISLSSHCFDRLPSLCSTLDVVAAVAFASAVVAATAAHLDCRLHNISWFLGILKKTKIFMCAYWAGETLAFILRSDFERFSVSCATTMFGRRALSEAHYFHSAKDIFLMIETLKMREREKHWLSLFRSVTRKTLATQLRAMSLFVGDIFRSYRC